MIWLGLGLKRSLPPKGASKEGAMEPISIIIAARNEENNLARLLTSIAQLEPIEAEYEVIIVNDHSTDESLEILKKWEGQFGIRVIDFQDRLPGFVGKKAALQKGIEAAKYDILAFTDADCKLPPTWLKEISRVMDEETDYLLGYSTIYRSDADSDLRMENFERSVYYILAAAGIAHRKPITASACNMVYRKSLFEKSGGFEGISEIRSGDDDLLLMKMMPNIRKAYYNPSRYMQVDCYEERNFETMHNKRIRQASKFKHHPRYVQLLSVMFFIYFAMFYAGIISFFFTGGDLILLGTLTLKFIFELMLSQKHLSHAKKTHIGILYFVYLVAFPVQYIYYAIRGTLGKYKW